MVKKNYIWLFSFTIGQLPESSVVVIREEANIPFPFKLGQKRFD